MSFFLIQKQNVYYVLDLVVVSGALTVELTTWFQAGPLFIVLLGWRMLRVLHGVATSVELQAKNKEEKLEEQRDKLQKELQTSRRALAKNKVRNLVLLVHSRAVVAFHFSLFF